MNKIIHVINIIGYATFGYFVIGRGTGIVFGIFFGLMIFFLDLAFEKDIILGEKQ